jgi:hypothetical protein
MKNAASKTLFHRFIPGLRFHSFWYYQARGSTGRVRWARLPMVSDACAQADPHGAWWCAQRCAAVLAQRPWRLMQQPPGLPAQPDAHQMAHVLQQWLPGWSAAPASVQVCTHALENGGSALLQLHVRARSAPNILWAWVVGVEVQARQSLQGLAPAPGSLQAGHLSPRALLIVPFGQDMPWATGHTARVRLHARGPQLRGPHEVVAQDGCWFEDSGLDAVLLKPVLRVQDERVSL